MDILLGFGNTLLGNLRDLLPIAAIILGFQWLIIRRPIANPRRVLIGFFYVLLGLSLFLLGLEQALFPLGRLMAQQLAYPDFLHAGIEAVVIETHWTAYYWIYLFGMAIGFSTAIAEPSLIAVAIKANQVSGGAIGVWGLRIAVALGVAIGIGLGTLRIVLGAPIHGFIIAGYVIVVIQTYFAPKLIIPLAYDLGGVTTSTVTVPLVTALGLGLAETVPGRSPLLDGFGMIALACLFPIVTVLAYAMFSDYQARRAARLRQVRESRSS